MIVIMIDNYNANYSDNNNDDNDNANYSDGDNDDNGSAWDNKNYSNNHHND